MATITGYRVADDGTMTPIYDGEAPDQGTEAAGGEQVLSYSSMTKKQLEDEVALRNAERDPEDVDFIEVEAPGNKAELVAALEADDQVDG